MIRKKRRAATGGALALAASILFSGILVAGSAHAAPASIDVVKIGSFTTGNDKIDKSGHSEALHDKPRKDRSPVLRYVALGDSYAAGFVAADGDLTCQQSDFSYPGVLDDVKHVNLIADGSCSGATTTDVVGQLSVIKKNKQVNLVTVTVGANDLMVADIAESCLADLTSQECLAAQAALAGILYPLPPDTSVLAERLSSTFSAVAAATPGATILATGYPYLFETPPANAPGAATIIAVNEATRALNATIAVIVAGIAASGVDIRYVDVTETFDGHGLGSADPWIIGSGPEAYHPNEAGYRAYAAAVQAALPSRHA